MIHFAIKTESNRSMNDNVDIFPWNDNFDTGIEVIDEQHRKLVDLLNLLASHLAYQSASPELDKIFAELADYAAYHFQTEEAIWSKYFDGDSWLTGHRETHERFIDEVLRIKKHQAEESNDEVMEEIVAFLTSWLAFHILESDKRMAKAVLAMQAGMGIDEAKHASDREFDGALKVLIEAVLQMYQNLSSRTLQLIREISRRQKAEFKLRLADSALESTMESIVITDAELTIIDVNPAFCVHTNRSENQLLGDKLDRIKTTLADTVRAEAIWSQIREKGHWSGEILEKNCNGELEPQWLTFSAIHNEHRQISNYVAIFSSISELVKRQQMLESIANNDPLTGLPNRRMLSECLEQAMAFAERDQNKLAVCYLDLDGFKQVNDRYGHAAGDQLLQEIARRFKSFIRKNDTVARLGGDEFVLLINDLSNTETMLALLDRLLAIVRKPVELENGQGFVSASIGVSIFPDDSLDANELLHFADEAMYRAKKQGKSRYCFYRQS